MTQCIKTHSWSEEVGEPKTIEAKIIADCDALDAAGAVGICRTVNYYTDKGLPLYDPNLKPNKKFLHRSSTMVNHFYEKLFLLDSKMYTKTCRKLVKGRIAFMKTFLREFLLEWEGKR